VKGAFRTTARRYARALLDVAAAQNVAPRVRDELRGAVALLDANPELASVLAHPALPLEKRKAIVTGVFPQGQLSEPMRRLLLLLVERGRIELLPHVESIYGELWNAQRGVVAAEAVAAVPLDAGQTEALTAALARATGKGVELATTVDPDVLGGLLVKMAGRVYDGTVRAQLRSLRARLTGASHT
jgi:F-type H+-transporting ATPase subunit delta